MDALHKSCDFHVKVSATDATDAAYKKYLMPPWPSNSTKVLAMPGDSSTTETRLASYRYVQAEGSPNTDYEERT